MSTCKTASVFVALVAVLIGIVGRMTPEIFLHIPNIGFIPFMLFGGNNGILPPFFDLGPWQGEEYNNWLRDGDVVVATGAKAGTTWMCYCLDAIRRKGSDKVGLPYTDIMLSTPWMELPQSPGEKWSERRAKYNTTTLADGTNLRDYWDHKDFPFRVFKSHYHPLQSPATDVLDVLPVKERPGVKYIMASRNGWEVAKSIHAFFPKHAPAFQKTWGGFPPHYADAETAMRALLPGGELYSIYFGYLNAWWPFVNEPNVLPLHFTDMVKDLPGLVDKLSNFVGVTLNAEERANVEEKCSFKHMKANSHLFDYKLPLNEHVESVMQSGGLINKGNSGNAKHGISEDAKQDFDEAFEKILTNPKLKKWAQGGGEI